MSIRILAVVSCVVGAAFAPHRAQAASDSLHRAIHSRIDVAAPIAAVWQLWSTRDGLREWFAPEATITLEPLSKFEILFAPQNPPGTRGAENNVLLAVQPEKLLSFSWDAPPANPEARRQRTFVSVRFQSVDATRTRVWFEQTGWGEGPVCRGNRALVVANFRHRT